MPAPSWTLTCWSRQMCLTMPAPTSFNVLELRSVGFTLLSDQFVDGLGASISMYCVLSKSRDSAKGNSRRCLYAPLHCVY